MLIINRPHGATGNIMEFKNCTECGNKYNADHECYECAAKESESDMQEEYDSTHN